MIEVTILNPRGGRVRIEDEQLIYNYVVEHVDN